MADPTDIQRLIGDILREGLIESIDLGAGKCRVRLADDFITGPIPWAASRLGKTRIWAPPSIGEQVLVVAPEGDTLRAIVTGSLRSDANPHPADDGSTRIVFEDGAAIGYDPAGHTLTVTLPAGAKIAIVADGGASLKGDLSVEGEIRSTKTITADQDVVGGGKSLKDHVHTKVQAGAAVSGPPQ
ncbi:phage baseplate assembly protein V [Sphingomonas melonis]|uniref:phage baseplate assembly protein V n=1 Tax=Sphingomonas melonis TaxID=152682 RepID=UPI00036998F5|nr:phage baseplate assembly protein V [Sphingomonas melonis]